MFQNQLFLQRTKTHTHTLAARERVSGRPFRHTLFFYNEEKRGLENEMMISRPALDLHPKGRPARNILSLDPLEIKIVFFLFLSERPLTAAQQKEKKRDEEGKNSQSFNSGDFFNDVSPDTAEEPNII